MSASPGMILLITNLPFWRDGKGAHQRIAGLSRFLQQHFMLHVLYLNRLSREDQEQLQSNFSELTVHTPSRASIFLRKARRRIQKELARCCPGRCDSWEDSCSEDSRTAQRLVQRIHPSVVIIEYAYLAKLGDAVKKDVPDTITLLDTIDAISLRTESLAGKGFGDASPSLTPEEEASRLRRFDALLAIQEVEASYFRQLLPGKTVLTAGHPEPVRPFEFNVQTPVNVLFVGADTQHNRIALKDFLEQVWPTLRKKSGDKVALKIVGRIAEMLRGGSTPQGVHLIGFVDDLDEIYARADIVVNPIFAGSGLKIKNVEALCHGKCLITTPIGAEGLSQSPTPPMAICDSLGEMTNVLCALVDDPDQRRVYAERAHQYATENLSENAVFKEFLSWLQKEVPKTARDACNNTEGNNQV